MENVQCTIGNTIQRLGIDSIIFGGGYDNEIIVVSLDNNEENMKYIVLKIYM